jgi:hypothetical protein
VSALARARIVYWTIVAGAVLLLILGLVMPGEPREGFDWLTALVAVVGAVAVAIAWWARHRPLRAGDGPALARAYVGRLMLVVVVAEIPAALGFAATLVADVPWPALVGAGSSLAALFLVAPTAADVDRREAQLADGGTGPSLRDALGATDG